MMKSKIGRDEVAAVLAGVGGSLAYYAEQQLDITIFGTNSDDVKMLGTIATRRWPLWYLLGFAAHCINGALLGVVYARTINRFLPGPGWLRGIVIAQIEIYVLCTVLIRQCDRYHHLLIY